MPLGSRPRLDTDTIATRGGSGRPITPDTPIPNRDGSHPNYAWAIEDLCWLEDNRHKLEDVAEARIELVGVD